MPLSAVAVWTSAAVVVAAAVAAGVWLRARRAEALVARLTVAAAEALVAAGAPDLGLDPARADDAQQLLDALGTTGVTEQLCDRLPVSCLETLDALYRATRTRPRGDCWPLLVHGSGALQRRRASRESSVSVDA